MQNAPSDGRKERLKGWKQTKQISKNVAPHHIEAEAAAIFPFKTPTT